MPPVYSKRFLTPHIHHAGDSRQTRTSPCEKECLTGNHIQQIHSFTADGDATEALRWLHARTPFPGITGRVCPHPCENACNRAAYDEKVSVRSLERFAADNGERSKFNSLPANGMKVAVIGSGPAGLSAAYFLNLFGYSIDIYEKSPIMGGTPRHAIPEFRLPRDIVDKETARAIEGKIRVYTNLPIGQDLKIPSLLQNYDAVLLASGLGRERILNIPGKEYLEPAVAWLKSTTLDRMSLENKNVIILGGGGVAFDCAFTAKRLKASSVKMVFLESVDKLRVPREEAEQAVEEKIEFYPAFLAQSVEKDQDKLIVTAQPVKSFYFDETGQLHTEMADDASIHLEGDLVICASGLLMDDGALAGLDIERGPAGHVRVNSSYSTSVNGLFAAGEIATGPSLIGTAVRNGREAAVSIHKTLNKIATELSIYIDGNNNVVIEEAQENLTPHKVLPAEIMNIEYHPKSERHRNSRKPRLEGVAFQELEDGMSAEGAMAEGARCMHCGHCMECGSCVEACPGHILQMGEDGPEVAYAAQCWHCGCCRIACPTSSISYKFPLTMMV